MKEAFGRPQILSVVVVGDLRRLKAIFGRCYQIFSLITNHPLPQSHHWKIVVISKEALAVLVLAAAKDITISHNS